MPDWIWFVLLACVLVAVVGFFGSNLVGLVNRVVNRFRRGSVHGPRGQD
jgi:hypothetical protein